MLTVCPTPIGNMQDVTQRQRQALESADIIACEDTRRAGKLLERLGVDRRDGHPRLWRYDEHTARGQVEPLIEAMEEGQQVVLISDAGTPTISDPGYRLVSHCRQRGVKVVALPGPVAAVVALSGSGLPTDRFFFEGFLPGRSASRQQRLKELCALGVTVVVYESPRRIVEALADLQAVCGARRQVCVARELTKRHEEYLVGEVNQVRQDLAARDAVKGEVVLCIAADNGSECAEAEDDEVDRLIASLHAQGVSKRTIKEVVAEVYDVARSELYDRIEAVTRG